jgi:hypothetical protein
MKPCSLCTKPIEPGTKAVELAGGFFPKDDPEFFALDDSVIVVSYVHLQCLLDATGARGRNVAG